MSNPLELTPNANKKLRVAKSAISAGAGVIAIKPRQKRPDIRFCPNGSSDATRSIKRVRRWLLEDDTINLAAVVKDTNLMVIDVDGPKGDIALESLGKLPSTRETQTKNGRHLYFRNDDQISGGSVISFAPELDIIVSGYVLLPESTHPDGGRYTSDEFAAPIAKLPSSIALAINTYRKRVRLDFTQSTRFAKGDRNNRLTSIAGALRRQAIDHQTIDLVLTGVNSAICSPPLPTSEVRKIAKSVSRYEPDADKLFGSMADVEPTDVRFLWYPYLVAGSINLLEGDPNTGKTFLLCKIAADISAGRPLPNQTEAPAGHVIFMSAEDDPSTTLVKRLMRMEADLEKISYSKRYFQLGDEALGWLQTEIEKTKAVLVIMDPLLAYMADGIDMNKANETRPFLSKLNELAKITGVTLVGLRHITKGDKEKAIYSGLGSIDITAAARSAVMVGIDPESPNIRAMAHFKHNLSEKGKTLTYEVIGGDHKRQIVPKVEWRGYAEYSADDLVARKAAKLGRPDDASRAAELFLKQRLSAGPMAFSKLEAEAEGRTFSSRTIRRAAKEIGVTKTGSMWSLAKKSL